ncbi:MAG: hypothetical protein ACKVZH_22400 [Blastocatellia bacterium]
MAVTPFVSVSARLSASNALNKALSIAPSPVRAAVKSRIDAWTKRSSSSLTLTTKATAFDAPITKIASPEDGTPVAQGQVITYTITVTNDGNDDETFDPNRLLVRDSIPTNTTYVPGSVAILQQPGGGSDPWTCSYNGGNNRIECLTPVGGDMRATTTFKFEFKVSVNPNVAYATIISNTAHFLNEQQSGANNITNSSNTTNHPVTAPADLTASKTSVPVVDPDGAGPLAPVALPVVGPNVPPGSVNSGGYIRYDIPFGNSGPANADNTIITDQIPGNTAFVGALATGGVFVPGAQPPAVPFTFTIPAVDTIAPLGPNVNLTCTVIGAPGSQTIYCRPDGNTALPAPGPYINGTLPSGYNGTLTFFVKVNESSAGGTVVSNPANIGSGLCQNAAPPIYPPASCAGTPDANTTNNTTLPTQTVVVASSNLTISKIVQSAVTVASNPNQTGPIGPATPPNGAGTTGTAVLPGTYMTYRVTLTNNGPSDVSSIRLTDVLPSGLETPPGRVLGVKYVSVNPVVPSSAIFTCAPPTGINPINNPQLNGGSVVCTAPLLSANAPNNTAAIDITVFIDGATKTSLVNVATVDATLNNFNRPVSGTTTLTTPVQPVSDLTLTKTTAPTTVFPGTYVLHTLTVSNLGPSVAAMTNVVDTLPPYQTFASADLSGAPGFTCSGTTVVTCSAPYLDINATAVIKLTVFVAVDAPAAVYTNTATATSMSFDPTPASATASITVVVKQQPGPGGPPFPVLSEASDQKAGSILFYPIYTSDASGGTIQNTRINITNTSVQEKVCVHLFAVDGASCSVADVFVCLTANQTTSFLASDLDPGSTGYMVALAVDCATGLPKGFNCLIGDEYVKFSSGHQANLAAVSVAASLVSPVGLDSQVATATLKFDGVAYNRLPRILASSTVMSLEDGNSTMLIIDRVGGNLGTSGATIGNITGLLIDDAETAFSFTVNLGVCQERRVLSNSFPRTLPPFSRAVPSGRTAWMKFWRSEDGALIGSQINFNPNSIASAGAFNQGHNLHALTLTDKAEIIVPIFIPSC